MEKSPSARAAYSRYIRKLDLEATVEAPQPFSPSTDSGEELGEPTSQARRRRNIPQDMADYARESWASWLVTGIIMVLLFLTYGSKIELARISSSIESLKERMLAVGDDSKERLRKSHDQELILREHSVLINQLEKQTERLNAAGLPQKTSGSVP